MYYVKHFNSMSYCMIIMHHRCMLWIWYCVRYLYTLRCIPSKGAIHRNSYPICVCNNLYKAPLLQSSVIRTRVSIVMK